MNSPSPPEITFTPLVQQTHSSMLYTEIGYVPCDGYKLTTCYNVERGYVQVCTHAALVYLPRLQSQATETVQPEEEQEGGVGQVWG